MTTYNVENNRLKRVLTDEAVLNIPEQVEVIESMAINSLASVSVINIPNSIKIIEKFAITQLPNLKSINTIPVSELFYDGVIKTGAIVDCDSLQMIKVPDNIIEIQDKAIVVKSCLTSIILPSKLKKIAIGFAQQQGNLTIDLSSSVEEIQSTKCKNLTFNINNDKFKVINGMLFSKENVLIYHNNVNKCIIPKNTNAWELGCLRSYKGEVISENKNLIIANGSMIVGNEIIDYCNNELTLYTNFNKNTIKSISLESLNIRSNVDLTDLTGYAKTINIKQGICLDKNALSKIDTKFIVYGKIKISIKAIEILSKALGVNYDRETYNNILTVLSFKNIPDEDLRFWLVYGEQYSYELYTELSKVLVDNMKQTMIECGQNTQELEDMMLGV